MTRRGTHPRTRLRPHDHIVLVCQGCHGDMWPLFRDANGRTIWECHACREWWTYTRWGWAMLMGAAAVRMQRG